MKKRAYIPSILDTSDAEVPRFSTGDVSKLLAIPIWRLQKFLDSPRYQLSPAGHLGKGRGSRRLFSTEDVYRIGVTAYLIQDGFAPKLVFEVLETLEDEDLLGLDQQGNLVSTGICFVRGAKRPELKFFSPGKPPQVLVGGPIYYALDLSDVIRDVDQRIRDLRHGNEG